MFSFIQATLLWINYLSHVHLCKQLYHMKISLWQFFPNSFPVPRNHQFWHHFCPIRIAPRHWVEGGGGRLHNKGRYGCAASAKPRPGKTSPKNLMPGQKSAQKSNDRASFHDF